MEFDSWHIHNLLSPQWEQGAYGLQEAKTKAFKKKQSEYEFYAFSTSIIQSNYFKHCFFCWFYKFLFHLTANGYEGFILIISPFNRGFNFRISHSHFNFQFLRKFLASLLGTTRSLQETYHWPKNICQKIFNKKNYLLQSHILANSKHLDLLAIGKNVPPPLFKQFVMGKTFRTIY